MCVSRVGGVLVRTLFFTEDCPTQISEMMGVCWNADKEKRPSFRSLNEQIVKIVHNSYIITSPTVTNVITTDTDNDYLTNYSSHSNQGGQEDTYVNGLNAAEYHRY